MSNDIFESQWKQMTNKNVRRGAIATASAIATALALTTSPAALADQREDSGLYIGGAYGLVSVDNNEFDDDDDALMIFLGYQFNPFFGIEGNYVDFGQVGNDLLRSDTDGYSLAVTGRIPLSERFAIYGKVGRFWWDNDIRAAGFRQRYSGNELTYGVGAQFEVTQSLDLRLAYDRLDVRLDADEVGPIANGRDLRSEVNMVSLGLQLEF